MSAIKEYYFDQLTSDFDCYEEVGYEFQEDMLDRLLEDKKEVARILADRFGINNEDWSM